MSELGGPSNSIILQCATTPQANYLGTLTYTWQKYGTVLPSETNVRYPVSDSGMYSCTARLNSQTVSSSNQVKVIISPSYLAAPTIFKSASKPVLGGRVILTCGDKRDDHVTYTWSKDRKAVGGQKDRKLQIDSFVSSDDGDYMCTAIKNTFFVSSSVVSVTSQATIEQPVINVYGDGTSLGENGYYFLSCDTDSETVGMTYEWTVAGNVSSVTDKYYILPSITKSDNGDYTCKAKFNSVVSVSSVTKTMTVTEPGMVCYEDTECIAAKTGYTDVCSANDRCVCSNGYIAVGEECLSTSGVMQIVGSALIITAASLLARFI
ncbi:hypothetical protein Btru_061313 [Bulinus truncatus]|nr:hypothetical protein Btru_061313 [Bulinus truncatus]